MAPETVTLEQALALLRLPRIVGADPATGEEILALNGRFGPYLKKGTDTRSLETEDQLLTVTLDEALALFAQPKTRRGRDARPPRCGSSARTPRPSRPSWSRSGRFGPYVTDGTTNASLRKGDEAETITVERAAELLADRRAAGPPVKRAKKAAKKAAKKTAKAAKKATKAAKAAKKCQEGRPSGREEDDHGGSGGDRDGDADDRRRRGRPRRRERARPADRPRGDRRLRQVDPGPVCWPIASERC